MPTFHLACDLDSLLEPLLNSVGSKDFFAPITIVPASRPIRTWLQVQVARRQGIAINLRLPFLEDALWEFFRQLDPRDHVQIPERLDDASYGLSVLSILLQENDASLAPLHRFIQGVDGYLTRAGWRRAWQLAERLGELIQEYEYHRQDQIIQPWLHGQPCSITFPRDLARLERAQRTLFNKFIDERTGRRTSLSRDLKRNFKTFPQYAMEVMDRNVVPQVNVPRERTPIHFFGLTHASAFHLHAIHCLSNYFEVHVYQANVLASRPASYVVLDFAESQTSDEDDLAPDVGKSLLNRWDGAGRQAIDLARRKLNCEPQLHGRIVPEGARKDETVLRRLQAMLAGQESSNERLPQDRSLQIGACPGIVREVETVYQSILHNLQSDPLLRTSDIAILVTDLTKYRPVLQAVFDRPPRRVPYSLEDVSALRQSLMGQAFLGMLDLALDAFRRSRVFEVLLNPCCLARSGVNREQALHWLKWAETLGIYQGWDADEKRDLGYAASPFFTWKLGLRRLRLGRFMEHAGDDLAQPCARFEHMLPFADVDSEDREQLDAFCAVMEGLLPRLHRLRRAQGNGKFWAKSLTYLLQNFLAVPEDHPEEGEIQRRLLEAITRLERWDAFPVRDPEAARLSLPMIRPYVASQLTHTPGHKGDYLTGGVTIAGLAAGKPIPFKIVYVVGMSESHFPGGNDLSSLDLRAVRQTGDIRPTELAHFAFLELLCNTREKLYLLWNNRDLQKDQPLLPASAVEHLLEFLRQQVVTHGRFEIFQAPLQRNDPTLLTPLPPYHDLGVQLQPLDRFLALAEGVREKSLDLTPVQAEEYSRRAEQMSARFAIPVAEQSERDDDISLKDLKLFLDLPAQAALQRHLRIRIEHDESETVLDDEPLVSNDGVARTITRHVLQALLSRHGMEDLSRWTELFPQVYEGAKLRCQVPESAFANIDAEVLTNQLATHIGKSLEPLREILKGTETIGPVRIGESRTPVHARISLAALEIENLKNLRILGSTPFLWAGMNRLDIVVLTTSKIDSPDNLHITMVEPALFFLALLAHQNVGNLLTSAKPDQSTLSIHVAGPEKLSSWRIEPGQISPAEATAYLTSLCQEFLDPTTYDVLPFTILKNAKYLGRSYWKGDDPWPHARVFVNAIEEAIDKSEDSGKGFQLPPEVSAIHASVPDDALEKVQRRFGLLARWLPNGAPAKSKRGTKK